MEGNTHQPVFQEASKGPKMQISPSSAKTFVLSPRPIQQQLRSMSGVIQTNEYVCAQAVDEFRTSPDSTLPHFLSCRSLADFQPYFANHSGSWLGHLPNPILSNVVSCTNRRVTSLS